MGGARIKGMSSIEGNVVTSLGGATSRLDEKLPCVRRHMRYSNRECPDATHRAEMVPAGVLRQSKVIKGGTELLYDKEGSPRNGI